ncbi:MAG: hypothetical protein C4581_13430 [Nitrospiraceae bacterium]|nr:MAG: hypothetical protein C4581_13430 [Nitrospiraceae bacterium]
MFKNKILRYLFFIFLILGIVSNVANIYFVLPHFEELFIRNVEDEAVRIGNHLSDMYFTENKPVKADDVAVIEHSINEHIKNLHLINLKIFSPDGEILYSLNRMDISTVNKKEYFHNIVANGRPYTKLVEKDTISLEGQNVIADVIEAYVPIMSEGRFMGAFEIYYDVTGKNDALHKAIFKASVMLVVMTVGGFILSIMILMQLDKTMTRQKKIEEDLKTYSDRLQNTNRELQDFAHIASHDLQEPLRKITAFSERLKTRYASVLDETGLDYMKRMQNAAHRMQNLIEGLLAYSRVTSKARAFEAVDLSAVAHEVLSDLELRIHNSGGKVEIGELPIIQADPLQMRQLLQNLIANALKFHREDEHPFVRVTSSSTNGGHPASGNLCHISIEDNGIGFDGKYTERIFGVFQRLHGRQEYEGSGIGLSVCRRIVERHGGSINVKSTPGKGAKFIITLPAEHREGESNVS